MIKIDTIKKNSIKIDIIYIQKQNIMKVDMIKIDMMNIELGGIININKETSNHVDYNLLFHLTSNYPLDKYDNFLY